MLSIRIPALYVLPAFAAGAALVILSYSAGAGRSVLPAPAVAESTATRACDTRFKRITSYKGISPLLSAETECEADRLSPVKREITAIIERHKAVNGLFRASVFLLNLDDAQWMVINDAEKFEPGSLMKVPTMIALLRQEEAEPGFLKKSVRYDSYPQGLPQVAFPPITPIEPGRTYTLEQLMTACIVHSDNAATLLLNQNLDMARFHRAFTDLGMADFSTGQNNYPMTAREFSMFMKAIYSSAYLSMDHSEFAMGLLGRSDFDAGMAAGLPDNVAMAHKFGEAHGPGLMQLHESGVVYLDGRAYLITVMTEGPTMEPLLGVLKEISAAAYKEMSRS